jgi:diamine N-acetyltransferase
MATTRTPENNSENNNRLPLLNITGEKVALGPMRRDLIPLYQKWDTDFAINRTTTHVRPVTLEEEAEAYDRYTKDPAHVFFTIYEKETLRPIGKAYLGDIARFTAEYGIVIGETECQGKGYGTETTCLVLDYAFTVLGLHNVLLTVMEYNLAGIKAYEKAGFRAIGRRRQARWMNGKLWDVIYMDCLATEFESPVLARLFIPDEPRG